MSEELRCPWSINDPYELEYHDKEWCVPSKDDTYLFEMLNLEGAQAGLSWKLILHKRKAYQEAFFGFDIAKCANLTDEQLAEIIAKAAIVKNRLKVKAVRTNAIATQKVQAEFGTFADYIWSFTNNKRIINKWDSVNSVPASNELSEKISKDLKKRGFKFVGPVIIYSYLQAIGMVDDHLITCPFHTLHREERR
ncbi:DNA-3-methyladenine glycosylase I [Listeria sp. FSL L7-1509]|uniref:DNA-3-methyladenine glycosylase I n=1 Tax=Listeria immobilis TaxID=2713502 RepID=A0ABR6SU83_9LIST|nr:DNA-3-methyladenine glycosylase I [Listeria immobilis]MBC1506478.1 DNA-3-methyladenine glycosylase I [Listeria immobilis]MBC1509238.1 DNA-3-methyladenine glycosylase I [Listeria immobilis]MBC6296028.1 DNA-3-methyladenine glycosylase I [Listeria immobilis]MBC6311817.1 DNA-3-methyladenine glycosylase I [Listeria immobilis]